MTPKNAKYSKDHEWVRVEGETAVVGITDYAQAALGDVTFIELPAQGKAVRAHQGLGVIESVKAASDVYSPVGGVVEETNKTLEAKPEIVNEAPYTAGWICKLNPFDSTGLPELMTAEQYDAYVEGLK